MILIVLDIILILLLLGILFYQFYRKEKYKKLHQIGRGADMRMRVDVLKRPSRENGDALSLKYGRREPRYSRHHRRFHHLNRQNIRQLTNP